MDGKPLIYSRRQALSLGRKALIGIGVCCLYPFGRFLTAQETPLAEARLGVNGLSLNDHWQKVGDTRFWLRQKGLAPEALWATCTHLGCEVSYDMSQELWQCPCHGSLFNGDGEAIKGPAQLPLARGHIQEKDGYYIVLQVAGYNGP